MRAALSCSRLHLHLSPARYHRIMLCLKSLSEPFTTPPAAAAAAAPAGALPSIASSSARGGGGIGASAWGTSTKTPSQGVGGAASMRRASSLPPWLVDAEHQAKVRNSRASI